MLLGFLGGSVYGGINAAPGSAGSGDPPLPIGGGWHQFDWGAGTPAATSPGPWTFDLGAFTGILDVTDVFLAGDVFEVFDSGGSIGLTSVPSTDNWTNNIDFAFADPRWSSGSFAMGPGAHSISINTVQNPYDYGSGYLRVNQGEPVIPEPASLVVWGLLAGLGLIVVHRKMKK